MIQNKKIKKFIERVAIVCISTTITIEVMNNIHSEKINSLKSEHTKSIEQYKEKINDLKIYEALYRDTTKDLAQVKNQYQDISTKLDTLVDKIELSKEEDEKYNESNFANKDLTEFPIYTIDEMNAWIAERAPEGSIFIGKGEEFLKASRESNLDPRYLVAHAALESGWGESNISKDKNNFYGISAYNHDPYTSAMDFESSENGIVSGARWIYENYTSKGQNTLNAMIWGEKAYCQNDDGTPSQDWIDKIVAIIYPN